MTQSTSEATTRTPETGAPVADRGLLARLVGIFFSPRETMAAVVAYPRWFGMLALVIVLGVGPMAWFVTTVPGRNATIDRNEKYMKVFSFLMSPEQMKEAQDQARARIENSPSWKLALQTSLGGLLGGPLVTLAIAGVLLLVFKVIMGGEARFKQVFAVVVHAGAISSLKEVLLAPLNYHNESFDSATTLRVFAPMLEDNSILGQILGSVDLFTLWWIFALAVGLSVLFRRKTTPIAISLFAVYAAFALVFASIAAFSAARS